MSELAPNALHAALHVERHAELRALIASSRQRLAGAVNAELTRLYWSVGHQLVQEFGRGFEAKNLRRRVQFAHAFPLPEIVATLSRSLIWSHFVNLLPLKTEPARQFYASHVSPTHEACVSCATPSNAKPSSAPSLPHCKPPHPKPHSPWSLKTPTS